MPGPQEATIQNLLHLMDGSAGQRALRIAVSVLVLISVVVGYNIRSYRNMASQEAMDSAQLARNLANGEGYTTKFIRPLSMHLHARQAEKKAGGVPALQLPDAYQVKGAHGDISNPPVYPVVLAGLMKILPFKHDALTASTFWYRENQFWRYQPDFLIGLFNQFLMLATIVCSWLLARRLFDEETAWISALALLGTEVLWRFSVSGLSTMLLMLLISGLLLLLHWIEAQTREPSPRSGRVLLGCATVGLVVGLAALTRYSMAALMVPVLAFLLIFGGRLRLASAGVTLLVFLVIVAPWLVRNVNASGKLFGTATYAAVEETGLLSDHRLQRSINPDMENVRAQVGYLQRTLRGR